MGAVENGANKQIASSISAEVTTLSIEGSKGGFQS